VQDRPRLAAETADYRCTLPHLARPVRVPRILDPPSHLAFSSRVARGSKRWRAPQRPLNSSATRRPTHLPIALVTG